MDPAFQKYLFEKGVDKNGVRVLTAEKVLSRHIFSYLKEEHIVRLLEKEGMSIGCHAILWDLWEADSTSFGTFIMPDYLRMRSKAKR